MRIARPTPTGSGAADFDLLSRLPGLEVLDVVATEEQLATGWLERVHELLPGLEEVRPAPPDVPLDAPVLVVPDGEARALHFESRDREEELADLVRRIRALHRESAERSLVARRDRLWPSAPVRVPGAGRVFESGGVALQSRDALPLAAEPFAAALDLVFSAVSTLSAPRRSTALLRSPHLGSASSAPSLADAAAALDVGLAAFDHGGRSRRASTNWRKGGTPARCDRRGSALDKEGAARAARVAAAIIRALEPLAVRSPASAALDLLLRSWTASSAPIPPDDPAIASG